MAFTPFTVIDEIMNVIDKESDGFARLKKLKEDLGYVAPEIRNSRFWGNKHSIKESLTDICKKHFNDNEKIRKIFHKAALKYAKEGFTYLNGYI